MKKKGLSYQDQAGFKVPENYFDDFERRMIGRVIAEEGIDRSPASPFRIPDGYFDQLEEKVMHRLQEKDGRVKVVPLFKRRAVSYIAGIAAVLAIVFTSVLLKKPGKTSFSDLDLIAVENYIMETFEFADPDEALFIDAGEMTFANSSKQIEREALLDYLRENIEEPALLLNEE